MQASDSWAKITRNERRATWADHDRIIALEQDIDRTEEHFDDLIGALNGVRAAFNKLAYTAALLAATGLINALLHLFPF